MVAIRRKPKNGRPKSVLGEILQKRKRPEMWLMISKPLIILLCLILLFIVYSNWSGLIAKLDNTPIRSYALTHQTAFTTNADVREALSKDPQLKGYFEQDIQEVEQKLRQIPWVKDVIVRKIYPDRLSITLFEHRPVAIWNNIDLVSDEGVVFNLPPERLDRSKLPHLFGPNTEGKTVLEAWDKIRQELVQRNLTLKSVAMDNRGSWLIQLENGVELRLGRGDWVSKIDRFVMILPEIDIPDGKKLSYVDLRYEHGAAVGFAVAK